MGFGLMLIGYFLTYIMALNSLGVVFRIFGYLIICRASWRLSAYNVRFNYTLYSAAILAVINTALSLGKLLEYLYANMVISSNVLGGAVAQVLEYADIGMTFVFHVALLLAIRSIAKETEVSKVSVSAVRNLILVAIYFVLSFIGELPTPFRAAYARKMVLPLTLIYLLWILLDIALIYSCYYRICDEGDEAMEQKPSRFAFVNKMRSALEARQDRAQREMAEYRAEKKNRKKKKR